MKKKKKKKKRKLKKKDGHFFFCFARVKVVSSPAESNDEKLGN